MLAWLSAFNAAAAIAGCQWYPYADRDGRAASLELGTFEARLNAGFAALKARGMSVIVAVTHAGGPLRVKEFGPLLRDGIAPEEALVDLGSITKTVTAIMAAKLVEQHKLSFDDTLAEVFGDAVPGDKAGITLHQLLTHSAGFEEAVGEDFEPLEKAEFLERAWASPLLAAPGTAYNYSNVGYGLVAAIVEQRSGKLYENYLREDVMADIGLNNLGYMSVHENARSLRTARGETIARASWGGHEPGWNLIGNGGLVSTVEDIVRFREAVVAHRVIGDELLSLVQTPHIPEITQDDPDATSFYGYGIVVDDVGGLGRVYWHDGGNDVYSAALADYADEGDIIFTAAVDSKSADASDAMSLLAAYLYDATDE
jgi:CubicO group peptidase (beta-lactamase class C family)